VEHPITPLRSATLILLGIFSVLLGKTGILLGIFGLEVGSPDPGSAGFLIGIRAD
jgi:hypothetical protein